MKKIIDIIQAALGLDGIKAGFSHLPQSLIHYFRSDDDMCCCCCHDGCC